MTKRTAAYIAGIVDGEGYIGLSKFQGKVYGARYRNKYSYKTRFVITNTDLPMLKLVQKNIGGRFDKRQRRAKHHKQGWNLVIPDVQKVLPKLIPFLRIKKRKAQLVNLASKMLVERKRLNNQAGNDYLNELGKIYRELKNVHI